MYRLLSLFAALVVAYFAAYAGEAMHAYISSPLNGWACTAPEGYRCLDAGPGWLGAIVCTIGTVGFCAAVLTWLALLDGKEVVKDSIHTGLQVLATPSVFLMLGAFGGPFETWGWNPLNWGASHLFMFPLTATIALVLAAIAIVDERIASIRRPVQADNVVPLNGGKKTA